ncbi:MAG TPA: ABC transporter permease [Longimicrobiales bacterium]|nr:ABC transporter permease [Longimicrobiales bacterium]
MNPMWGPPPGDGPRPALRRLLALFPRKHRAAYGEEIWEVARYRWDRQGGGWLATLALIRDLTSGAAVLRVEQLGRGMRGMGQGLGMDARFVLRSLGKSWGYVITAVTVLACAVAANATVFSYVKGTLLSEPAWPDAEEVSIVWARNLENGQLRDVVSGPNVVDMRERLTTARVAAFHYDGTYFDAEGRPEVVSTLDVEVDFFRVLGVEPALGRGFGESERYSGGQPTVVVSHAFWRDRLGGADDVVGAPILLEGVPHIVIGVLAEDFQFVAPAPILRPLTDDYMAGRSRSSPHFNVLARGLPGATHDDLQLELAAFTRELTAEFAEVEGWDFHAERLDTVMVEAVRPVILVLVGTVLLVLLVALVNLGMLFRVRTAVRDGEIAVRRALGASRTVLVRILALEPLLLAAVGAGLGLAVTPWFLGRVADLVPVWIAIPDSAARVPAVRAELAPGVAAVTFVIALLGALALTAPAFAAVLRSRQGPAPGSDRRVRSGIAGVRALVGLELAFTTVLCVGAALLVRSFDRMMSTEPGVQAEGVLAIRFGDVWEQPVPDQARYLRDVVEAVEAVPGVERAGTIDYLPFLAEDDFARIYFLDQELQPVRELREEWRRVDANVLEAAGMRMVAGRWFDSDDLEGTVRSAVVNASFAQKHYPDGNAVGRLLSTHDENYRDMRIVGVVADVRSLGPTAPAPPMLYVPQQGNPRGTVGMYVRTSVAEPMALGTRVREAIWSVDSSQPVIDVVPLQEMVGEWVAIPRAARGLVSALAALAWVLSVVGVFGVASYAVRSRRGELGIRMALGASARRLTSEQVRAMTPVLVLGVGGGLLLASGLGRLSKALLFGVAPLDPVSLVTAALVTSVAAMAAVWWPARSVSRIDPAETLNAE